MSALLFGRSGVIAMGVARKAEIMADEKRGSGVTTRENMRKLSEHAAAQFKGQLDQMSGGRVGFKKKQIAEMMTGFDAGALAMIEHLEKMGVFVFVEVPSSSTEEG